MPLKMISHLEWKRRLACFEDFWKFSQLIFESQQKLKSLWRDLNVSTLCWQRIRRWKRPPPATEAMNMRRKMFSYLKLPSAEPSAKYFGLNTKGFKFIHRKTIPNHLWKVNHGILLCEWRGENFTRTATNNKFWAREAVWNPLPFSRRI